MMPVEPTAFAFLLGIVVGASLAAVGLVFGYFLGTVTIHSSEEK